MSLRPDCTYQEIPNQAGGSVKSYIMTAESAEYTAEREALAATIAEQAPYLNPDLVQIKKDIQTAFAGSLGALGGIYAIVESYLNDRN